MKQLQAGDLKAFDMLYMKYKTPLFSYFVGHCREISLAEDLLQDLFIKLLANCQNFRFESKFSTWIWVLARNQMIDHWRSVGHRFDQEKLNTKESDEVLENLISTLTGPEEQIMKQADDRAVRECLNELPTSQKDAVLLRSHGELSYDDIAQQLNSTVSAVKSLLVRAKEKLLDCLRSGGHV